jgi:hypothetical protein
MVAGTRARGTSARAKIVTVVVLPPEARADLKGEPGPKPKLTLAETNDAVDEPR